eukprot:8122965-Heterocapsa_arctica.AAC.1
MPEIASALSRRCDGAHGHGVTCGVSAKAFAYYTPCLVQAVGRAACGTTSTTTMKKAASARGLQVHEGITRDPARL